MEPDTKRRKQESPPSTLSSPAPPSSFLASMTFASGTVQRTRCDCDECGRRSMIPMTIRNAIQEYHAQKRHPMKRTQSRRLIQRQQAAVLWEWILPLHSEPLLEFGNPKMCRIIWVRKLRPGHCLKHIGTGIVGSASEENGRIDLNWKEKEVYLLFGTENKAMGWIVECLNETKDTLQSPAELVIAKIPLADSETSPQERGKGQDPAKVGLDAVCRRILGSRLSTLPTTDKANLPTIKVNENDASVFREAAMDLFMTN